ncbi:MAG: hypothetical protein K6C08_11080 [Oscillospiraceae bacterium]|nr:hypothetical protein [Oscillospiraceae bacterium]
MTFENPAAIGQAYILSSPSREDAVRQARQIAQAAVCLAGHNVPCGVCRGCRKALASVHPDIVTVRRLTDKDGRPKRDLSVAQIRELSLDAQVLPNESERKAYIIEEAELLNPNAQNAALKLLEEPPRTVVFLLCTTNPELLLETVRSRCAFIRLGGDGDGGSEESRKMADGYLKAVTGGDFRTLAHWVSENETGRLDETRAFIDAALQLCAEMVCGRRPAGVLSPEQQMRLYRLLSRCAEYLKVNVNAKHIFSLLLADSVSGEQE